MLHIVNGDCAIEALKDSGIEGYFLSCLDVLHDEPVLEGLSQEEQSEFRADFIADCDWAILEKAKNVFQKGILFPANVTNTTKLFFGTAFNCLISCISCSCYTVLRKRGKIFST